MVPIYRAAVSPLKHRTEQSMQRRRGKDVRFFIGPLSQSLSTPLQDWRHIGGAKRPLKHSI